MIDNLLKVTVF